MIEFAKFNLPNLINRKKGFRSLRANKRTKSTGSEDRSDRFSVIYQNFSFGSHSEPFGTIRNSSALDSVLLTFEQLKQSQNFTLIAIEKKNDFDLNALNQER